MTIEMTAEVPREEARRTLTPRRRRILFRALIVVALISVVLYMRFFAKVAVRTHTIQRGDIASQVFGRGTIESKREAQLGFDLVGRLSQVLVDEGTRVTLGQELARLQPDQVRADLGAARTGVAAARTSLLRLDAEERRARAAFEAAEREQNRARSLHGSGVIAQHELDAAVDGFQIARAELDRVLAQRAEATRSIDVAEGGATQRQVTVLRATLLAPFDGLVTRRLREPGDTVSVGTTVLRIVDTDQAYVSAWVDETVLGRLREGQMVEIRLPEARSVPGVVSRIGFESDRQTHELLVDIAPAKPLGRIAIGQRADVWITTETKPNVVRVPVEFIQRDADGPYCYVDRNGRTAEARVKLGLVGRDAIEVREGLREGDTVLAPVKPGAALKNGRRWEGA